MRLDHIAYRVKDRTKTTQFFIEAMRYRRAEDEELDNGEFLINFDDGSTAKCVVLEPPEKSIGLPGPWVYGHPIDGSIYHQAPEIFVSEGSSDSVVGKWVAKRDNVGGIHHLAYQVISVQKTMDEWRAKGYAEFTTNDPLTCPGLTQCFTKPSELTGVIFEFIEREAQGFCRENVRDLMESTGDLS